MFGSFPLAIPLSWPSSFNSNSNLNNRNDNGNDGQGTSFLQRMGLNYQPRHFSLPPMSKVSETLGALNFLGRYILKRTKSPSPPPPKPNYSNNYYSHSPNNDYLGGGYYPLPPAPTTISSEEAASTEDLIVAPSETDKVSSPVLTVKPEEDAQLGNALYTLGRNVLGQVRNLYVL